MIPGKGMLSIQHVLLGRGERLMFGQSKQGSKMWKFANFTCFRSLPEGNQLLDQHHLPSTAAAQSPARRRS